MVINVSLLVSQANRVGNCAAEFTTVAGLNGHFGVHITGESSQRTVRLDPIHVAITY